MNQTLNNLIIVKAFANERETGCNSAKLLVSSILKSMTSCDVVVLKKTSKPFYAVERARLREIDISYIDIQHADSNSFYYYLCEIIPLDFYSNVLIVQEGVLFLRNIDHLFLDNKYDIKVFFPKKTVYKKSAIIAIHPQSQNDDRKCLVDVVCMKASLFRKIALEINQFYLASNNPLEREVTSFQEFIDQTQLCVGKFEAGEVLALNRNTCSFTDVFSSALIICKDFETDEIDKILFSLYVGHFYYDPDFTLFNLIEN